MAKKDKDPKRVAAGKRSKTKGNQFEREVAAALGEWWGAEFHRTPLSGGSGLAAGWNLHGDVVTNDVTFPFSVECKNRKDAPKISALIAGRLGKFPDWVRQCREGAPNSLSMIVFKSEGTAWVSIPIKSWRFASLKGEYGLALIRLGSESWVVIPLASLMLVDKNGSITYDSTEDYEQVKRVVFGKLESVPNPIQSPIARGGFNRNAV